MATFNRLLSVYQRVHQTWLGYPHGKHVVQKSDMFLSSHAGYSIPLLSQYQGNNVCAISMVFKHKKMVLQWMNISTHSSTTTQKVYFFFKHYVWEPHGTPIFGCMFFFFNPVNQHGCDYSYRSRLQGRQWRYQGLNLGTRNRSPWLVVYLPL